MKKIMFRKKKIANPAKLISWISRNLDIEMRIVRFYEDNLHLFKDEGSRKKIRKLVHASLEHSQLFVDAMHRLQGGVKSKIKIPSKIARKNALFTLANAMREERGAEDLYKFQARRINDKETVDVLLHIAKEEVEHQAIVKDIAADIAKGLPEKDRKRILKKLYLT